MWRAGVVADRSAQPSRRTVERALVDLRATPAENLERGRVAQGLARDVAAVHDEIAGLSGEAAASVEQATAALAEFEREHALTLGRAQAGVRDLAAAAQVELDAALEALLPELVSGRSLPVA